MDTNLQTVQESQETSKKSFFARWFWVIVGFIALLILSAGLIFLLVKKYKTQTTVNIEKVEDIRNKFVLPSTTNNSDLSSDIVATPTPTTGESNLPIKPLVTPTPKLTPTPTPEATVYENINLGFSIAVPYNWQSTVGSDGHTVVFTNSENENFSIQSYALTNETLELIKEQLLGSSSVTGVKNTTFLNQPALAFKTIQDNKFGIATIYNNKIYYIIAKSFNTPPVDSFEFR
jgi:cytoskeletal protein RodZ